MFNVAIVGPSELIGQELLKILAQRRFPVDNLQLFEGPTNYASARPVNFGGREIAVKEITGRAMPWLTTNTSQLLRQWSGGRISRVP